MIDFEEDILSNDSDSPQFSNDSVNWVTKYRPHTLEHFCLDSNLKSRFQKQIEHNNIQNCALIGSQGIGKTTLALILAKSSIENDVLFIPCAIEGKVETIQSKVIPFCQSAGRGRKVIILDELDSASATQANSFQKSLRNSIELFNDCSWIATANYQSNIIPPVLSRLPPVSLTFSVSDMVNNLVRILNEEKIELVGETMKTRQFLGGLIKSTYPDMRMCIGLLQNACLGGKLNVDDAIIDNKEVVGQAMAQFLAIINSSETPLALRKAYNNEVLSLGQNNSGLSELCSQYGLAKGLFDHIVENFNPSASDLLVLVDHLYRIEHCVDQETMLFGFLLKVKEMNLK